MYAAGDVENPELDTIDYMEDLVVDWLAELVCPFILTAVLFGSFVLIFSAHPLHLFVPVLPPHSSLLD